MAVVSRWIAFGKPRVFSAGRFRRRQKFKPDYELLAGTVLKLLKFDSVLDVGCGNGFLIEEFKRANKRVSGIDFSPAVKAAVCPEIRELVKVGDFSEAAGVCDLVCCAEVAEHIPRERSEELVVKLTELARHWIYFTAAPPGQLGYAHINCRPHEEWLAYFQQRGWVPDMALTEALRNQLGDLRQATWLRRNSFILTPNNQTRPTPANHVLRQPVPHAHTL